MTDKVIAFSLRDTPSLIENFFPAQKVSIESFKEREARQGQILTTTGSYWKGRKPLVLSRACVLAALLPSTQDPILDLEIFDLLMGLDEESMLIRLGNPADGLPKEPLRELIKKAKRTDEFQDFPRAHIWKKVNQHLGTSAQSMKELVSQLGIMRYGHTPRVADTFSGSGQIPFAAAQLGCEVYASDLNPISCMLTWSAFNIVGANSEARENIEVNQKILFESVKKQIDDLQIEMDGNGWRGKVYLYCLEVRCPSSGWMVPVLPSRIISKGRSAIVELVPDEKNKRYDILVRSGVSPSEFKAAEIGTYNLGHVVHVVDGVEHRNKISSIRGDYIETIDGKKIIKNKLRQWDKNDFIYKDTDIYNERLYAIQWVKDDGGLRSESEFRSVTIEDLKREKIAADFVSKNLENWQKSGLIPDTLIEAGEKTDEPIRTRGWTHWHHLFNPRQLLVFSLWNVDPRATNKIPLFQAMNNNCRLSRWNPHSGVGQTVGVFDNQALNTLYNYGTRGLSFLQSFLLQKYQKNEITTPITIVNSPVAELKVSNDIYITDPPYGDAVKYEEILEFFIAWLAKRPPKEFSNWTWDSRRVLAVKGEDHDFKLSMVSAYKRMTECMPDNGVQIIMFTHQSGSIWADMANIVWASGLKVSAAWYIVTETDSALREGQYVKGTILLVLRKRVSQLESFRDELAYELRDEVKREVELLTGLNKSSKESSAENLFEDADIQMAGYAAALRVLTKYAVIDGVDMQKESMRPRVKDQTTIVDDLIEFAVGIANQYLVPEGLSKEVWDSLEGSERFYLKMLDMEAKGINALSNYQNFAKAFKVSDFSILLGDAKANKAQLKTAELFGKRGMGSSDDFGETNVRNTLYAIFLLMENKISSDDVLHQLKELIPDFYRKRDLLISIADYVNKKTSGIREIESQSARILRDLIRNERV